MSITRLVEKVLCSKMNDTQHVDISFDFLLCWVIT